MAICYGLTSTRCLSSCCYIARKEVSLEEADSLGLENVVKRGDRFIIKSKDYFGTCTFLDEEAQTCDLGDKRPYVCRSYHCRGIPGFDLLWQEVRHYRRKRGIDPK
jgi:Fe-S-cluster containining protein